jgi:hypothetical protein
VRRTEITHRVARIGPLDLYDLGAGLGEDQAGEGAGQQGREVDYRDTVQRLHASPPAIKISAMSFNRRTPE